MSDAAPSLPTQFQIYDSYQIDPTYQRRFSIVWSSVAAFFVLVALPSFIWSLRIGRVWDALIGVREDPKSNEPLATVRRKAQHTTSDKHRMVLSPFTLIKALTMWSMPLVGLDFGQLALVVAYYVTIVLCIVLNAELVDNPNRAGFLAIAQLPPVFLFATKNSPLAVLISSGYEKLNYLHRWCSRGLVLAAAVHGSLWIRNHLQYGLQILGAQKETSGVATFALLGILALTSVRPMRIHVYQIFRLIHLLAVPAFFVTLRYHTLYAAPYIYPPLAFYGLDLLLRLVRFRAKDATLVAPDSQMTVIRVHDCTSGWSVGQHIRLRVFFANRMFESHPLTIMNAPRATTCLGDIGVDNEILLAARVQGDWSRALNDYVRENSVPAAEEKISSEESSNVVVASEIVVENIQAGRLNVADLPSPSKTGDVTETLTIDPRFWSAASCASAQVMLDGPYGGCSLDLSAFENVLLVAGGSGVTFILGLLDDLVGRCVKLGRRNGEVTRRVEFAWCIRSFGALGWLAPFLSTIAARAAAKKSTLDLHITVYVTCLCKPEDVPLIANCDVLLERPSIRKLVGYFDEPVDVDLEPKKSVARSSGLAICAAGPESLTCEVKNAAARLSLRNPSRRMACRTEAYFL